MGVYGFLFYHGCLKTTHFLCRTAWGIKNPYFCSLSGWGALKPGLNNIVWQSNHCSFQLCAFSGLYNGSKPCLSDTLGTPPGSKMWKPAWFAFCCRAVNFSSAALDNWMKINIYCQHSVKIQISLLGVWRDFWNVLYCLVFLFSFIFFRGCFPVICLKKQYS